jgi:L-alanine-DL-glutamate epimerase-like enolase superfamily enzyme
MEIKVFRLKLALKNPFRIAHGSYAYRENLFVWLREGNSFAMGEAPVVPYYGLSADEIEEDLKSGLSHRAVLDALLGRGSPGGCFAYPVSTCAFLAATLELRAKLDGLLPPDLLGIARGGATPPSSYTLAYDDDPEAMVAVAAASGFRRLKLKAGIPGDIERIKAVRASFPEAIIRVDANQGWSFEEARSKLPELEDAGVELLEEPMAGSPAQLEELASSTSIPIVLDESLRGLEDLRRYAKEAPSLAGIVVKTAKNGGPAASLALARAAAESGLRIMLSSMVETSLGVASALCLSPLCAWLDLDAPLLLAEDPFTGLAYEKEVPILAPGGVFPGAALAAYVEGLEPLFKEA